MTRNALFEAIRPYAPERRFTPEDVAAIDALADRWGLARVEGVAVAPGKLAWGAKVSPAFRVRVREIAADLRCEPSNLMACIAWESGETFSASVGNMAGSGAVGLIQFMPSTAVGLGTTTAALAAMTPERQLDWVAKYFRPYQGKLATLADLYMAILWPAAVGRPLDSALWDKASRPTTYRQNAGLDANRDGIITKAECAGKVYAKLEKGMQAGYVA